MITGKCKTDFEKWRLNIHQKEWVEKPDSKGGYEYYGYSIFKELPFSMQYGVMVDFFDSVGIYSRSGRNRMDMPKENYYWFVRYKSHLPVYLDMVDDLDTARTEEINKSNEIYNTNLTITL